MKPLIDELEYLDGILKHATEIESLYLSELWDNEDEETQYPQLLILSRQQLKVLKNAISVIYGNAAVMKFSLKMQSLIAEVKSPAPMTRAPGLSRKSSRGGQKSKKPRG